MDLDPALDTPIPDALIERLVRVRGLSPSSARQIVEEVAGFYSETLEEFVIRRHLELRAQGKRNAEIYRQVREEIRRRRFRSPLPSERRIRRIVYG
ncbi:hypothetical protein [Thioalkalivibrio sp. HK1]|uniref:hypothetical protein n=1 Tax=Thioalkalivibrio sp. HK1 TaxID=1469245 RepID=UPI00046F561D|nr:hypothetical protein [Thioalkalivibrio sp. HK1]